MPARIYNGGLSQQLSIAYGGEMAREPAGAFCVKLKFEENFEPTSPSVIRC